MLKKILSLVAAVFLLSGTCFGLTACRGNKDDGKLKIVCTVFPIYDWVKNIVGNTDKAEVILLASNGTDIHSYQPTARDMVNISNCDIIVYVGGESDAWVEKALENSTASERVAAKLSEASGVVLRDISVASYDENGVVENEHSHHNHGSTDEHIWLSLKNAAACVSYITELICGIDAEGTENYKSNCEKYISEIGALDCEYGEFVSSISEPVMVFADRFPFVYMTEDYGIKYMAAFEGCTTETDATPETIIRLAEYADKMNAKYITVTESSDKKLAQSVIGATKNKDKDIAVLDSLQSVSTEKIENGETYLSIMRKNLNVLRTVLTK